MFVLGEDSVPSLGDVPFFTCLPCVLCTQPKQSLLKVNLIMAALHTFLSMT